MNWIPSLAVMAVIALAGPGCAPRAARTTTALAEEHALLADAWLQSAAERRALYHQGFALARLALDRELAQGPRPSPRAIIVDIDETVLDNGPYLAGLTRGGGRLWTTNWPEWVEAAAAEATPGSLAFLRYASSRGARIFYITGREEADRAGTSKNLQRLGFPDVSEETLLLRTTEDSKEPRRQRVMARYHVVLLIGDNLGDCAREFETGTPAERASLVEAQAARFGTTCIVLPNPRYGNWMNALYRFQYGLPPTERRARLVQSLRYFLPNERPARAQ